MKFKKLINYILLAASTLLIFSCHNSLELIKKRYRPGYYIAFTGERARKNPLPAHAQQAEDSIASKTFTYPEAHQDFSKPSAINSENLTASITKPENDILLKQKIKIQQSNVHNRGQSFPQHFFSASIHHADAPPPSAIPKLYKAAIFFLLLCLLSLLFGFISILLPTIPILAYIGAIFPEAWLTGLILSIIGFFKYRNNQDPISTVPKGPDLFSRSALILELLQLVMLPLIVIAMLLILYSIIPLITLVYLFGGMFILGFVFSVIGLIRVLKDPQQSKKNRLKSILISIFSLIPACLLLAMFIAVGSFIAAALPYLGFLIFILH